MIGRTVDFRWERKDFGPGIIDQLNSDSSLKKSVIDIRSFAIKASLDDGCWAISMTMSDGPPIPTRELWDCYSSLAQHLPSVEWGPVSEHAKVVSRLQHPGFPKRWCGGGLLGFIGGLFATAMSLLYIISVFSDVSRRFLLGLGIGIGVLLITYLVTLAVIPLAVRVYDRLPRKEPGGPPRPQIFPGRRMPP